MTAAAAHRALCRLGLHLWGRWRIRQGKAGQQYRVCASCRRDNWRAMPEKRNAIGDPTFAATPASFPVDRLGFPKADA